MIKVKVGDVYNCLTVMAETDKRLDNKKVFLCNCSCGTVNFEALSVRLTSGKTKSCGCLRGKPTNLRHGNYVDHKVEYSCWANMLGRCFKQHLKVYKHYGGRGITVCDRWNPASGGSFDNFLMDMGKRPSKGHSLDRIENDGNYEPSNCRWATRAIQEHNKRHVGNKTKTPRGVLYSERDDLWTARITIDGKKIILGYSKDRDVAISLRKEGELKYLPEVYRDKQDD